MFYKNNYDYEIYVRNLSNMEKMIKHQKNIFVYKFTQDDFLHKKLDISNMPVDLISMLKNNKSINFEGQKKTIIFLRSNRIDQEIRVPKEIDLCKKLGYNIYVDYKIEDVLEDFNSLHIKDKLSKEDIETINNKEE